ncbi:MAG: phage portal protein [Patescibacteria group bacterium]|jgi:HK97 family phage portal protein
MLAKSITPMDLLPSTIKGKPQGSKYSKSTVITNGLAASVIVYACTTLVARTVASVPWRVTVGGEAAPADHPLVELIAKPNPAWTWNQLQQHVMYSLQLWGEGFMPKIRARALGPSALYPKKGLPAELWITKPNLLDPIRGDSKVISGYQKHGDLKGPIISPEDLIHPVFVHPDDIHRGLAPLEPGQNDVNVDVQAGEWQAHSLENRAVPDGVFKPKEFLTDDQFNEALEHLREEYAGAANARRPLLLGLDMEWIAMSQTAVEMDFLNGRAYTSGNICTVFGVPPEMVGAREAKYKNYETAERVLWTQTVLPNVYMLRDLYNAQLAAEFGDDVALVPDLSGVDALLRIFGERWDIAAKMIDKGVPVAVANEVLRLGLPTFPGQQFTAPTLAAMKELFAAGVPMKVINGALGLGLPPYPGWEVGYLPSSTVTVDSVLGGGM